MSAWTLFRRLGFIPRRERVSVEWLQSHRAAEREDHHNVCINWPINKQKDDQARWNTYRLKKRA